MLEEIFQDKKSPKYHVYKYLTKRKEEFKNKTAIDLPAGTGVTSYILKNIGCKVEAFDLFPEYFKAEGLVCKKANILEKLPVADSSADYFICQEGIEHFSDQLIVFKEINRSLKRGGTLLLTTPNFSNLKSKFGHLVFETEVFNKQMPPNEIDSIWLADSTSKGEVYYGHIFMSGVQELRVLGRLSGFKLKETVFTNINKTSLWLLPFFYPIIFLSSVYTYFRSMKKRKDVDVTTKKSVYLEQFKLNISLKTLLDGTCFMVFEKELELNEVYSSLSKTFTERQG